MDSQTDLEKWIIIIIMLMIGITLNIIGLLMNPTGDDLFDIYSLAHIFIPMGIYIAIFI